MSKSLSESQRIFKYISDNPLSTIRSIADNYSKRRANYVTVKKIIKDLLDSKKIEQIKNAKGSFFVSPTKANFAKTLSKIILSENITKTRFKKLQYCDYPQTTWTVEQIVSNLICLFHKYCKFQEISKKSKTSRKQDLKKVQREFWRQYDFKMKGYSLDDIQNAYTHVISENYPIVKTKLAIHAHKLELEKIWPLVLEYVETKSYRAVADKHKNTTTKNARKLLRQVIDDSGNFSWEKASRVKENETGNIFIGFDPNIFNILLKSNATDKELMDYLFVTETGLYEKDSDKVWLSILKQTVDTLSSS